jgi:hypothetical protein
MSKGQSGFVFLFGLALFLIIIGIQGNLGLTFAILFCPAYVTLDE